MNIGSLLMLLGFLLGVWHTALTRRAHRRVVRELRTQCLRQQEEYYGLQEMHFRQVHQLIQIIDDSPLLRTAQQNAVIEELRRQLYLYNEES